LSLFVCPECGFQDSPIWKSSHWRRYCVYANVSEVEVFFPELLEKLRKSPDGWVYESPYWFQLNKKGTIVNRMTQMGRDEFRTHGFTEKPKDPFQIKLEAKV
jgi:hypothetical protein